MDRIFWFVAMLLLATGSAAACPNFNLSGDTHHLSGRDLYSEHRYSVQAGGDISIQACPQVRPGTDRGQGFVTERPDFTFNLSGMGGYRLVIAVESACDSVLLVNTASVNWYYDDDDNGNLDARIILTQPANGWLDVWIGTHDGSICDAMLSMETFDR